MKKNKKLIKELKEKGFTTREILEILIHLEIHELEKKAYEKNN